jgi:hypothetical protein
MLMLISRRYKRASVIVTSNKPFLGWGDIFGDDILAAAMIDRLVHHAELLALNGYSYGLKDRRPRPRRPHRLTRARPAQLRLALRARLRTARRDPTRGVSFRPAQEAVAERPVRS